MDFLTGIEQSALATWIRESPSLFAYPAILFLHTVGLAFVAGTSAIVGLRVLGVAPQIALRPLDKLYPVIWVGFWMTVFSGVLLWMTDASTMTRSPLFLTKVGVIALAIICVARLRARLFRTPVLEISPVPGVRLLASLSVILWILAITAGRMTAYFK